jgi:hypothetical protein
MRDSRLPDDVRRAVERAPIQFWTCLNHDHKFVTWTGDVARCDDCGLTSEMTNEWMRLVRAAALREAADEAAGKPGSPWPHFAQWLRNRADQIEQETSHA